MWARVISAPANVLSRMSVLLDLFEQQVSGEHRAAYYDGVTKYLQLYYKDRDKLPTDETNGNQPLVSTYEVAWYSWRVTHDERIARLIEQDQIKNMIDLCYQTLALADIDRGEVRGEDQEQRRAHSLAAAARAGSGPCASRRSSRRPNSRPGTRCGRCTRPASPRTIRRWRRRSVICWDGSSRSAAGWIRCNPTKISARRSARRRCRCWRSARISRRTSIARDGIRPRRRSSRTIRRSCCAISTTYGIQPPAALLERDQAGGGIERCAHPAAGGRSVGTDRRARHARPARAPAGRPQQAGAAHGGLGDAAGLQPARRTIAVGRADLGAGLARRPRPLGRDARLRHALRRARPPFRTGRAADRAGRRSCADRPHAGAEGALAVLVLVAGRGREIRDRRHVPERHGQAAASLGGAQSARRHLQPGRREHPLFLQQLGAAAGAAGGPHARHSGPAGRGGAAGG